MSRTTHSARIIGPVPYRASDDLYRDIPLGPCLVERDGGPLVDIVWGTSGEYSTVLQVEEIASAQDSGHLVLLD